jgi:tRNA 5-methylaminomethyl-2-thiouridine biosynthesis bifunctional protein
MLTWRHNTIPFSTFFQDSYYQQDGMAESDYVYIQGNQITERQEKPLYVGETGFGVGLNFLLAHHARNGQPLHYYSVEKYPIMAIDIQKALQPFAVPDLDAFLAMYQPATGVYFLGNTTLHLLVGEGVEMLEQLPNESINAWFFDGFAPSRNPALWQADIFRIAARKSAAGATFATFTAARQVRDGLTDANFSWQKVPGFGTKRDMLKGFLCALS